MAVYRSSTFSRTRENEAKMGAYYTDIAHCHILRQFFSFPEGEEVSVLEPCIGDGKAVLAVTDAERNPNIKIFGVELNDVVAAEDKKNPLFTEILSSDFLNGVHIQKNSFSFCFGNPPYLTEKDDIGDSFRMERAFLEKVVPFLIIGAVLVWVIPYSRFIESSYVRLWMRNFDTLALYKFQEPEYSKFHQVVIIGRKVHCRTLSKEQVDNYYGEWSLADIPTLPDTPQERFDVLPSASSDITTFTTRIFDENAAYSFLENGLACEILDVMERHAFQAVYEGETLLRPPLVPKKDSKYLLVTSGFTNGEVGSVAEKNLHMMRGVANIIETSSYISSTEDDGEANTVSVSTSTAVELRIIENNGKITLLQ